MFSFVDYRVRSKGKKRATLLSLVLRFRTKVMTIRQISDAFARSTLRLLPERMVNRSELGNG